LTNVSNYVIGNIREGIIDNTFKKYSITKFVGCNKCECFSKCTNVCIASQHEAGLMFKPIKEVCALTNMLYEEVQVLEPHKDFIKERLLSVYYRQQNCRGE
jgi:sulfatase maturation enzyme AslB (radical SAM superfamily)